MKKNLEIVALEIVDGCNLYCSFCARNALSKDLKYLELNCFKTLIRRIKSLHPRPQIALTGGEPMMHRNLSGILDILEQQKYIYSITTNGTIQNFRILNQLSNSEYFKHFIISLDSYLPMTHDLIRGKSGAFTRTISFIEYIKDIGIDFCLNMTVNRDNYLDVEKTIHFAKQIGAKNISIATVKPSGRGTADLTLEEFRKIAKQIENTLFIMNENFSIYAAEVTIFLYHYSLYKESYERGDNFSCGFADSTLHIEYNGNIQGCATCTLSLANIYEQNFNLFEFWKNNQILNDIRSKEKLSGQCKKCKFVNFCGGCRCRALALTKDLFGDDEYCPIIQKGSNYEEYV